jgi:polysaccharide biosynthesis/export protein
MEMNPMLRTIGVIAVLSFFLGSCTINKNIMFKTDREFTYGQMNFDSTNAEYRLAPNDIITLAVFTNGGNLLLENTTTSAERSRVVSVTDFVYQLDVRGNVELPVVGVHQLQGMTIIEAQRYLMEKYSVQYNNPYIVVRVINRRIMVFPGTGGEGAVVPLLNTNVSVIEALALAGGIALRGNASKVKLIRDVGAKQEVYLIDLSTIEGIKYANMPVQAGDILYVEPTPDIASEVLRDVQPVFQILSSLALIYLIFTRN